MPQAPNQCGLWGMFLRIATYSAGQLGARLAAIELLFVRTCAAQTRSRLGRLLAMGLSRLGNGWIYPVIAVACLVLAGRQALEVILIAAVNVALLHCMYRRIKLWCRRARPYQSYPELNPLLPALDEHSFPSGHAMTLTAVLVPLALAFPLLLIPAGALWLFMAWARLASAHHYGSDILAGAGLALGVAYPISSWTLERLATVP